MPLAVLAGGPFVLVVHPSLPVHSVPDLVKLAKEKPGQLWYGSGGPGNPSHVTAEMLKFMTGVDMVHVAYKGTAPALNDVVGGPCALDVRRPSSSTAIDLGRKGESPRGDFEQASALLPNIPTMSEAGVAGFDAVFWPLLVAPADTPTPMVTNPHAEFAAILGTFEVQEWMVRNPTTPADARSPEDGAGSSTLNWHGGHSARQWASPDRNKTNRSTPNFARSRW